MYLDDEYIVTNLNSGFVEHSFDKYPYKILLQCCSLIKFAENHYTDFWNEFSQYITETGDREMDFVYYDKIPLTDDGKYSLSLGIVDLSEVKVFRIYCDGE